MDPVIRPKTPNKNKKTLSETFVVFQHKDFVFTASEKKKKERSMSF